MCPFVETIRWTSEGALRLPYHEKRLNDTRRHFWPGCPWVDLEAQLAATSGQCEGKCRVVYDGGGIREITFAPYVPRPVRSLRLVEADALVYTYKSTDREAINRYFAQRGEFDEVLFVRNGLLTDTSIANIALYDGNAWYTPATPLLKGTCRASLIDAGIVHEKDIRPDELSAYSRVRLFNAMLDWGGVDLPVDVLKNI